MKNRILSAVEKISLSDVLSDVDKIKNECFTELELEEIEGRHLQTLAGVYAVKKAFIKILDQKNKINAVKENQIVKLRNADGAPHIETVININNIDLRNIIISIAHTSQNAYGFVTVKETG